MGDANHSKPPTGLDGGVRKLTLSCSRCRTSKLKCDRREPCVECVKRNIGRLCTKDERQPRRAKRSKTEHKDKTSSKHDPTPNEDGEAEAEETAQLLEHFVEGVPHADAYLHPALRPSSSSVAPDFSNRYWSSSDPKRYGEELALIRETVDAMPCLEMIHHLFDVFATRCQGPLGNVVHTPMFAKQAEQLGNCLSLASPDLRVLAILSTFTMETLGCFLLALVLGLAFHPTPLLLGYTPTPLALAVEELRTSDMLSRTWRSLSLRCLQDGVSVFCGSIAGLQAAVMLLLDGQEGSLALDAVLVTAISGARKLGLHQLGSSTLDAFASQSAPLGNGTTQPAEPLHIRTETGIRIWWALVQRDWSRGQALGYYTIQPSQFNTRMPLHVNDDDLCLSTGEVNVHRKIAERPRSEFTMMSYTVHALEIAGMVRESVDLSAFPTQQPDATTESANLRKHLNNKYEKYLTCLPTYFRLGSTVGLTATGLTAAIPVQRWMLHQQLWSLLLRLHRPNLSSPVGRTFCQLLARNIIDKQAQIQARCAVCSSLSTNETQLFNAAVVLILDLLFAAKQGHTDNASAQLSRLMTRDKIGEAIELLRTNSITEVSSPHDPHLKQAKGPAQRGVVALEALMKLVEDSDADQTGANHSNGAAGSHPGHLLAAKNSLRTKVTEILLAFSSRAEPPVGAPFLEPQARLGSFAPFDVSKPFASAIDRCPDLDVLPILSNSSSPNFWQFLELPSPPIASQAKDVAFGTLGDLPGSLGLGTSQFADSYDPTPSTSMKQTSP